MRSTPHHKCNQDRQGQQDRSRQPGRYVDTHIAGGQPADPHGEHNPDRRQNQQPNIATTQICPRYPLGEMPHKRAGRQRQRQGDVHQQPGHLFAGGGVGGESRNRPGGQRQPERLPPPDEPHNCCQPEHQSQHFVNAQSDRVVIPGLVAAGFFLLHQPISQALPRSGE